MLRKTCCLLLVALCWFNFSVEQTQAQQKDKENPLAKAKSEIYKKVGDVELKMYIFEPQGAKSDTPRPAIVFFFGGGWKGGSPSQFVPHCEYLASRGMVAMAAEYRIHSKHKVNVSQCVTDAKSAIRWARSQAKTLNIDPQRIASGGGSAGGHLAAAVATLEGFEEAGEDQTISSKPNAMLLFNPALDLTATGFQVEENSPRMAELYTRLGAKPAELSPNHHIAAGLPPAIVFHGKADTTVPYAQAEKFAELMQAAGNRCQLVGYAGEAHGFFNFGRGGNKAYTATLSEADEFFTSLGYLPAKPTLQPKAE